MVLFGFVASFVSAPKYGYIFTIIFICNLAALLCFGYLIRINGRWTFAVFVPFIFALYTTVDATLRIFLGMRVLDIVR